MNHHNPYPAKCVRGESLRHQHAKAMAVDWSQLPKELLQLISEKLDCELYLIRFRSVCSSWRSSSNPKHSHCNYLSLKIPQFPNVHSYSYPVCHLSKHNIFLIKPPQTRHHHHRPWLVRIGPNKNHKIQLWHPFSHPPRLPLPFPHRVLDFNQISVLHVEHMFLLYNPRNQNYCEKLLFATCDCDGKQLVFMVTLNFVRQLMLRRCGDEPWRIIPDITISLIGDICLFKGMPCVVDSYGKTVMIKPDLSYHLIAEPLFNDNTRKNYKKSLLQIDCELLLVDRYVVGHGKVGDDVRIDVFRLDEKQKNWVKLTSLGDRVLFLGTGYLFSASASELGLANGNCVIYTHKYNSYGKRNATGGISVFHLDQNRASPLSDHPDYLKLFWPPPEWISELHS